MESPVPSATEPLVFALLPLSVAFVVVSSALLWYRRNVFPLNGRSIPLVIAMTISITASQPLIVYRLLGRRGDVPCWWIVVQRSAELAIYELIVLRVTRFWVKLNLSSTHLKHYRSRRFRIANKDENMRSPTSGSFSRSLRWAWFAQTANLSKILVAVYLLCLAVLMVIRFTLEDTCDSIMETFSAVGAVLCYIFVLTFGWKARHFHDGFYIRKELTYISIIIILVAICATITFTLANPAFLFLLWFFNNHGIVVLALYPLVVSYGCTDFQPFFPWTWCGCVRQKAKPSEDRTADLELSSILTNEDLKDLREEFEDHLTSEFSIENISFWDSATDFLENSEDLSDDEQALTATRIYFEFVKEGSLNEVNVPAAMRLNIEQELRSKINNLDQLNPLLRRMKRMSTVFSLPKRAVEMDPFAASHPPADAPDLSKSGSVRAAPPETNVDLNDRVSQTVFEPAREEVYKLMARDSFKRWLAINRNSPREMPSA